MHIRFILSVGLLFCACVVIFIFEEKSNNSPSLFKKPKPSTLRFLGFQDNSRVNYQKREMSDNNDNLMQIVGGN